VARKLLKEVLVPMWCKKNPQHSHKKEIPIRTQAEEHYTFYEEEE
jgi:hypothetical protein